MDKEKVLEILKKYLEEAKRLYNSRSGIDYDAIRKCCNGIDITIKTTFGEESEEYKQLIEWKQFTNDEFCKHLDISYAADLKDYINVTENILQKYEIIGIESDTKKLESEEKSRDTKPDIKKGQYTPIQVLQGYLDEIPALRAKQSGNTDYILWKDRVRDTLELLFTRRSTEYSKFTTHVWSYKRGASKAEKKREYLDALNIYQTDLESIIQRQNIKNMVTQSGMKHDETSPPTAFIAHEGETGALTKLKTFLDAIGVNYKIAEIEPTDGQSVEKHVTSVYQSTDFAIILATKGKVINKKTKKPYMGMNVADELGRAREQFKNKIILLLQKDVEPHTNISEIVHERFTQNRMDEAFIKIVKELKNWGFIKAQKP